jgi:tRNA modification GTPase
MNLPGAADTIAAIATPPGRSAIAVLRMSGADAFRIAERVLSPWRAAPRSAYLAELRDPATHAVIDRPVITVYQAPRSYTGEDSVEISVHGGHLVPSLAFAALLDAGARGALPGEFTRRAVANGKLDVLQAEGVADLVDARSRAMHHAAITQLDGSLSHRIAQLRSAVLDLEALIAYDIDFPEEDEGPVAASRVDAAISGVLRALDMLLATADTGEIIREGAVVVIAGAPNVGKSSLFNALLGQSRAIVTEIAGTTRDALEAVMDIGRWPVRLVDTAGLRETSDVVERLGIEVSERYLRGAHIVLACGDDHDTMENAVARTRALTDAPIVPVLTKCDRGVLSASTSHTATVQVSATTGAGLGALARCLGELLSTRYGEVTADVPMLTRERHRIAVTRARAEVALFDQSWHGRSVPAVIAAVHLRSAAAALEELIGAVDVEDVLDRVFGAFCVGK